MSALHLKLPVFLICLLVTGQWHSAVRKDDSRLSLENKNVRAVFETGSDGLLKESYYSRSVSGKWTLVLSQFTPVYQAGDTSEIQLWNTTINPHRFLMQKMMVKKLTRRISGDEQFVTIQLEQDKNRFTQEVSLKKDNSFFHVEVDGSLPGNHPELDYAISAYTFQHKGAPGFVHTPGLKFDDIRSGRGRDQIIGDRAFLSPAIVLQQNELFTALVPDLKSINEKRTLSYDARSNVIFTPNKLFVVPVPPSSISMPDGIDLNIKSNLTPFPVITYGLMDAKVGYHTRFVRDEEDMQMVRKLYNGNIGYGFDLLLNAVTPGEEGYPIASKHIWKYYGAPVFEDSPHLAMPYLDYLKLVEKTIFSPMRDDSGKLYKIPGGYLEPPVEGYEDHGSWLQWENNGQAIGGFRCAAPQFADVVNNTVFWNQARDAVGMYYWGKEINDTFLLARAKMLVNFCLSAPRNQMGLFSTVYATREKKWGIGWSDPPHGKNVLFMDDAKSYEIPPLCKTGAHLLDYYLRSEKDERIIHYLTPFANWLLTVIDEKGIIPSYVNLDMTVSPILYESAQPAAGMWFLAEMYNATGNNKYLAGAKKIAAYVEKEIIPTAKWIDMEQYVSCGQKPFTMVRDEWQGQWFRGTLCTIWACEGFAALNEATHDDRFLKAGEKCLDYLSFSQSSWSPNFVYTANPFGGFGTDNSDDAVLMDQRQAEFVKSYLYYGMKLKRKDLLERGVAAGQAACLLIRSKRHIANGMTPSPLFYPEGLAPENVDHEGISQWPMRTHALWGEGIAVFTGLSEIQRSLGGLYIDLDNNIVVGANGIKVVDNKLLAGGERKIDVESFLSAKYLSYPYAADFNVTTVIKGSGEKLLLNNEPATKGTSTLTITPNADLGFFDR